MNAEEMLMVVRKFVSYGAPDSYDDQGPNKFDWGFFETMSYKDKLSLDDVAKCAHRLRKYRNTQMPRAFSECGLEWNPHWDTLIEQTEEAAAAVVPTVTCAEYDETWYGKTRVGLHGQIDPEYDPDRTDPLTLSEAFGSRILRDHLLIGAMESSLLDPFTPRQRGLVCLLSLVVTGLLTCILVEQPDVSSELVVVGSTLAAFTVSVVLQHIYEEYQPRVRTVVPYLDERTGQYGLAKLSEAEGVANDIKETAAEQKRKVTLEESRRRKQK